MGGTRGEKRREEEGSDRVTRVVLEGEAGRDVIIYDWSDWSDWSDWN